MKKLIEMPYKDGKVIVAVEVPGEAAMRLRLADHLSHNRYRFSL